MSDSICRLSIDIEAGGDTPEHRALLEIGICVVGDEEKGISVLFAPNPLSYDRHALAAIRRPIQEFIDYGVDLTIGINQVLDWVDCVSEGKAIEFVGLNMPYDWMFFRVCVAKVHAIHTLPYKAYDIASYGAGVFKTQLCSTGDSRLVEQITKCSPDLVEKYGLFKEKHIPHKALDDARYQSRLLQALEECALGIGVDSNNHFFL